MPEFFQLQTKRTVKATCFSHIYKRLENKEQDETSRGY